MSFLPIPKNVLFDLNSAAADKSPGEVMARLSTDWSHWHLMTYIKSKPVMQLSAISIVLNFYDTNVVGT